MYDKQVKTVEEAVNALADEPDRSLIPELKEEQASAATGLEYYGITKMVFERFLSEKPLRASTRRRLLDAIKAVRFMFES